MKLFYIETRCTIKKFTVVEAETEEEARQDPFNNVIEEGEYGIEQWKILSVKEEEADE